MPGIYDFAWTEWPIAIHFPKKNRRVTPGIVQPWFWYLKQQTPQYFVFLAPQGGWGVGWERRQLLPIIKILPIDTQPERPTSQVGFGSLEEAIDRTNAGEPISQDAWGRFYWAGPQADKWWWKVVDGRDPQDAAGTDGGLPEYTIKKGCPTQPFRNGLPVGKDITQTFKEAVEKWRTNWNNGAGRFNAAAAGVSPGGRYTCILPDNGGFEVPGPNPGESFPDLIKKLGKEQYAGAVPLTEVLFPGDALIIKQAFAFEYEVAQLDPTEWDFTAFPPKRTTTGASGRGPFSETHDASANNPQQVGGVFPAFPQNSPNIMFT
jgi:hypothetical protein